MLRCLGRACARAEVPAFKVAWWRQAAASITKEKFTPREQANFPLGEILAPEDVDEAAAAAAAMEGEEEGAREGLLKDLALARTTRPHLQPCLRRVHDADDEYGAAPGIQSVRELVGSIRVQPPAGRGEG